MSASSGRLTYGRVSIDYEVRWSASRKTLAIEVHPDGRVLVRAPAGCRADLIAERVRRRAAWISRQLADFERYRPRTPARHYVSGESHRYLGRQYRLKVLTSETTAVKVTSGHLLVSLPESSDPQRVKAVLHRWYRHRASVLFAEALAASLHRFESIEPPRLSVRNMQSRWGSLSHAGTLTLNVDLVRAARSCIEYVVTHELCHLKHRHHGAAFYRLLERVMPDWAKRKERLELSLV
jgi:predicted metal-dependent hydrolase